jgi:hypothetical protein
MSQKIYYGSWSGARGLHLPALTVNFIMLLVVGWIVVDIAIGL